MTAFKSMGVAAACSLVFLLLASFMASACRASAPASRPAAAPGPAPPTAVQEADTGPGKIAFASNKDGNAEIYAINADGSHQTRLTNNSDEDGFPSWSPDGARIAFQSSRDGNWEIYVMSADGSNQTRLTNNPDLDMLPAWSPDGTRIAYVSRVGEGSEEIYVMDTDGSNQVHLTFNLKEEAFPTWSPDGTRIAFTSTRGGRREIYVMDADGSNQVPLADASTSGDFHRHEAPAWSQDGARIAFHSPRGGLDRIYVINADGTNETRLANNPEPTADLFPAWSPDGARIAFVSDRDGAGERYVMHADGTNTTRLTNDLSIDLAPAWAHGSVGPSSALSTVSPGRAASIEPDADGGLQLVGTALTEEAESPLAGVYVHGNYAFVGSQSVAYGAPHIKTGIRILDISDPTNPKLVGRIPLRSLEFGSHNGGGEGGHSHGDAVATRIESAAFQGDIAIVLQGVPDSFTVAEYPMPFGIWDVTNATAPQFLGPLSLGNPFPADSLGDKPNDTKAVNGHYFYAIYSTGQVEEGHGSTNEKNHHLAIVDLSDPHNPVVAGRWQDTKQVGLRGLSVNKLGTRVYVMGQFGKQLILYVLDVQDPAVPVELARFVWPYPFAGGFSPGRPVPNADDSLLIFADGSWEEGRDSRLHILDISDLSSIREVSTVAFPEHRNLWPWSGRWSWAHDVAIRGNLVYSTWLEGGVQLIDVSDPANPVKVGGFFSPAKKGRFLFIPSPEKPALSDVALFGDYAVATTVWGPGLYILR